MLTGSCWPCGKFPVSGSLSSGMLGVPCHAQVILPLESGIIVLCRATQAMVQLTLVSPAVRRLRKDYEFEVSVGCKAKSCTDQVANQPIERGIVAHA